MGLEPYGRIGTGILELVAGILLLFRKMAWAGALLTLGIIGGAIVMHLTRLGIVINRDGGLLFFTALLTFVLSGSIAFTYRKDIPFLKF